MQRLAQGFREGLRSFGEALRSFREAQRCFREVFWGSVDAVAGHRGALGCVFLPVAAFLAVIFCPPRCSELHSVQWGHLFSSTCGIRCRQCSPLFWRLQNSVPERASYGTEYACRAKKGFWGTEGIFGTGNAILRYATHLKRRETADSADCGLPSAAPDTS